MCLERRDTKQQMFQDYVPLPKFSRFLLLLIKLVLISMPLCMLTMNMQGQMVPSMVDSAVQCRDAAGHTVQGEINQRFIVEIMASGIFLN